MSNLPGITVPSPDADGWRQRLRARANELVTKGVYIGTSSWKYPGWQGQVYDPQRYLYRGRFSETRFNRDCLSEYAEVFPTVCVDAAYYQFPTTKYLERLHDSVPSHFRFGYKVTDEITIRQFPNLSRFGSRAGQVNPGFLNADLYLSAFQSPLELHREQTGIIVFEFSRFYPTDFARGREFVDRLDEFLSHLTRGWPYGVEIRNRSFLHRDYFDVLRRHQVAHVYNSWQQMPSVAEQIRLEEHPPHEALSAARFLLRPGRKYAQAVESFSPYERVQETNAEGREAGRNLIQRQKQAGQGKTFIFVNNRFEGNAPGTIAAMVGSETERQTPKA